MNLRQLKYFIKIVEAGNITRAAELLYVAQPALGMQIRQLESELQVPLLVRHSRGVEPSDAGRLLFERAREILALVEAMRRDVSAFSGNTHEHIRVGLSPSLMATLGADLMMAAKRRMPDLMVSLTEGLSFSLVDAVEKDELDLALAYEVEELAGLQQMLLSTEELVFVVSPAQAAPGLQIGLADLLKRDLVLAGPRDSVRRVLETAAHRLSMTPRVAFEVQSMAGIKRLVAQGLGAAVLPLAVVREEVGSGELCACRIADPPLVRKLFLVKATGRPELRKEAEFIDLMGTMLEHAATLSPELICVAQAPSSFQHLPATVGPSVSTPPAPA